MGATEINWAERIEGLEDYLRQPDPKPATEFTDGTEPCGQPSDPSLTTPTVVDRDRWFPGINDYQPDAIEACRGCPFQLPCLHWSVHHEEHGTWAGVGRVNRWKIRRHLGIALTPPEDGMFPIAVDRHLRSDQAKARRDTGRLHRVGGKFAPKTRDSGMDNAA